MVGVLAGLSLRRVLRWVVRVVLAVVGALVVYVAVTAVQVWLTSRHSEPRAVDAIVVMGAAQDNGVPTADLRARLDEAYALYERHLAPIIVTTGSNEAGDVYTEAQTGECYLDGGAGPDCPPAQAGVAPPGPPLPASAVVGVGGSDSWENLRDAAQFLHRCGQERVLVVTDGFHEDRSVAIAGAVGLQAWPVPASHSPITGWSTVPYFAKETLGVAVGRVIGYDHLETFHRSSGGATVALPDAARCPASG